MSVSDRIDSCSNQVLDDLTRLYFGPGDLDEISHEDSDLAIARLRYDLDVEKDGEQRFRLWALLYLIDDAPSPAATFYDPTDFEAARVFEEMFGGSIKHIAESEEKLWGQHSRAKGAIDGASII